MRTSDPRGEDDKKISLVKKKARLDGKVWLRNRVRRR